jgi:tetratricopeptide (TPR) repeat protein
MYAMNLMAETNLNKSLTQQEVQEMRKLAIVHFEKAVNIYPDYYNVYIDMARATLMTGDYQRGIDAIDKAIAIDPENQYSYYFSLSLLERTGDFETYLKHAEKLFELNENEESYGGLARGYFQLKDYKKSKEILLEGLKLYPDNEGLKYNLNFVEQSMK